ncbi:hypothetical protein [Emticicia sp. BO119]|nr:hypothetical protein [Emticicia sp. BO119]MBA4851828.1 hypothetical protein [Emticicia sp. BO119]
MNLIVNDIYFQSVLIYYENSFADSETQIKVLTKAQTMGVIHGLPSGRGN